MEPQWRKNIMTFLGVLGTGLGFVGISLTGSKHSSEAGPYDKYDYFLNGWLPMAIGLTCISIASVYYFTVMVQDKTTQIYVLYFVTVLAMVMGAYASWYSSVRMRLAA